MNNNRDLDEPQTGREAPQEHETKQDGNGWAEVRSAINQAVRQTSSLARKNWKTRVSGLNTKRLLPAAALVVGLLMIAVVGYLVVSRAEPASAQSPSNRNAPRSPAQSPPERPGESPLTELFGPQPSSPQEPSLPWYQVAAQTTLKLAIAALLTGLLAFRPRRDVPVFQRNPYVAQTQILLAVVAAALMMIVSDNAARAFGIFAAASLVRFRTNIRDPKEITVLLISLAIGLASGVGKMELALILSLFVFLMLSVLEYYEPEQVFRAMELTVTTRKLDETDEALREIFEKRSITSEMRKMDREGDDNPLGKIVYFVNVGGDLSTDKLSEEIFASDPENIDSIQWDQKKTSSYVYR